MPRPKQKQKKDSAFVKHLRPKLSPDSSSASQIEHIGKHFDGLKKSGEGFKALCPAHDDSNPSLSINEGADGRVLIKCHAGCTIEDVLTEVGLKLSDLRPTKKRIVATYPYLDVQGTLLYECVRYEPKEFRQRSPKPEGGWNWSTKGIERVLYHLPELVKAKASRSVFVVEGEKDADALSELKLVATCNIGGAGKWCDEYSTYLKDRHVVILPDNDEAGRQHGLEVAQRLHGIAASVKIVDLPELPPKGDVSDWVADGGTRKRLLQIVKKSPKIDPSAFQPARAKSNTSNNLISYAPPKLKDAALYGFAGDFIRKVSPDTEATDAGVLAHLLPAFGTLIGSSPHVWAGNEQPARINTALVGPTSTGRKGTSFAPVNLLMNQFASDFWLEQCVRGLASGEGLIQKVSDERTKNENGDWEIVSVEKRLYVVESEFSKILMQIRRDGNILSQVIREAYDSGSLAVLTRNPLSANDAHISITGHITPEELKSRFSQIEIDLLP